MIDDALGRRRDRESLGYEHRRTSTRFIPEREFNAIPEPEFVINHTQVILYDMFRGSDGVSYFFVLQAFGNELDDSVFTFIWDTGAIPSICRHTCLRYNRVASFTRLIPPVIPKRRNKRLK